MRSVVTDDLRDCGHHLVSNHQQRAFDQLQRWQFLSVREALGGHCTDVIAVPWTTNIRKEKNTVEKKNVQRHLEVLYVSSKSLREKEKKSSLDTFS